MAVDEARQSMAEPGSRGISRRGVLIGTAATATTLAAGALGLDALARSLNQIEVEEPETVPEGILEGKVRVIVRGAKLRKDPNRLDVMEKDKDGRDVNVNLVYWNQLDTLNGTSLGRRSEFFVENPEIVWGYNPDDVNGQPAPWIRLRAVRNWPLLGDPNKKKESYLYLSISNKTKNSIQTEFSTGIFHKVQKFEDGKFITDAKPFAKTEVGKITFVQPLKAAA